MAVSLLLDSSRVLLSASRNWKITEGVWEFSCSSLINVEAQPLQPHPELALAGGRAGGPVHTPGQPWSLGFLAVAEDSLWGDHAGLSLPLYIP